MHFDVLVYQFGKVASTTVVETLQAIPDVAAYQSHFLGVQFLHETLNRLVRPGEPEYFFKHGEGQLVNNIRLQRLLNFYKQGDVKDKKLAIISTAREPLDWFRSALVQDFVEYKKYFCKISEKYNKKECSDVEEVEFSVKFFLERVLLCMKSLGSIDDISAELKPGRRDFEYFVGDRHIDDFLERLLQLFLRPHVWFQKQYAVTLESDPFTYLPIGDHVLHKNLNWADAYIFRYEDLNSALPKICEHFGISNNIEIKVENISSKKDYGYEIRELFKGPLAQQVRARSVSEYINFFGYAA